MVDSNSGRRRAVTRSPLLWILVALGALIAVAGVVWSGPVPYDLVSSAYPGDLSVALMALARLVALLTGSVTAGAAAFATFFVSHHPDGLLGGAGYAARQTASKAAAVWTVAAAVMVFMTAADGAGVTVRDMLEQGAFGTLYDAMEAPNAWTVSFLAAAIVALVLRAALHWTTVAATLCLSVPGVIAPGMVGNNGQGADHDQATNLLMLHSAAAALWLGVLIATWAYLRTLDEDGASTAAEVLRRVRWFTAVVLVVLGGTGVGLTWIQIHDGDLTSTYGLLALGQAAATLVLVLIAVVRARRRAPAGATPRPRAVIPDVALVLAVFAVAAVTARIPSPAILYTAASAHQIYIGYDVPGPWTWMGLLTRWRVDLLWLTIALAMIAVYLLAVRSVRRAGGSWPRHRLVFWTAGWLLVVVATSSGINLWSSAQFSMHMVLHLILNLAAAPLLVAAAPLGLARVAGPERPGGISGPREWATTFLRSGLVRTLTHPWVALTIYVITLFFFYLTPLFDDVIRYHWGHQWMNFHFLVTGFLFFWPILGIDLLYKRPGTLGRVALLLAIMPFHALFGIVLMTSDTLLGNTFYEAFDLLDADALHHDQLIGGVLVWISGEIPVLVAVVVLLARWLRDELGDGGPSGDDDDESDESRLLDELRELRS